MTLSRHLAGIGLAAVLHLSCFSLAGCNSDDGTAGDDDDDACGPATGIIAEVIDGDTVILESGERVRYLMIDTPEITNGHDDCFGENAAKLNRDLVLGKSVALRYDLECMDRFGRLLAYVTVGDTEVNALMVERGYACVLYIPPNGEDRRDEFEDLEYAAQLSLRGMWNPDVCAEVTCQ